MIEAVDSIQSIVELYRIWLLLPELQASPEPRVLICMQAKLLYYFFRHRRVKQLDATTDNLTA